jgi:hypothetical protein
MLVAGCAALAPAFGAPDMWLLGVPLALAAGWALIRPGSAGRQIL